MIQAVFHCVLILVWRYLNQYPTPYPLPRRALLRLKVYFIKRLNNSLSWANILIGSDFGTSSQVTVEPPGPSACIDFTDLVVDDSVALEGDEAFTILVGDSMAMVNIIDDDGEQLGLNIESVTKNSNLLIVKL